MHRQRCCNTYRGSRICLRGPCNFQIIDSPVFPKITSVGFAQEVLGYTVILVLASLPCHRAPHSWKFCSKHNQNECLCLGKLGRGRGLKLSRGQRTKGRGQMLSWHLLLRFHRFQGRYCPAHQMILCLRVFWTCILNNFSRAIIFYGSLLTLKAKDYHWVSLKTQLASG